MISKTVKVAQLSFWFVHAQQFCSLAKLTEGVELVGCWDSDVERGSAQAARFGCSFEPDLDKLLSREDIDAVSICAEPFLNPKLAESAAKAGKAILIEKALAGHLSDAEKIVKAVQRYGVQAMPAYNLRFHPVALSMKRIVDSGQMGHLHRVRRLHGHSMAYERGNFDGDEISKNMHWVDPTEEKRGSLFFSGSHAALWFIWMFGPPKYVSAVATTASKNLIVEDNTIVLMEWENGLIGTMESSETLIAQGPVSEIYGTEGVLLQYSGNLPSTRVWNTDYTPLRYFNRTLNEWQVPLLPPQFLRHELKYSSAGVFLQSLLDGEPFPIDMVDGFNSIAILSAAEEALSTRSNVLVKSWQDSESQELTL